MSKSLQKRVIAVLFAFFLAGQAFAQFGNEWIRFNQQYFKIPVAKDGIYRLRYEDLQAAGFPANADYQRLQLFHRGMEQRITIVKNNTGISQLEPGDYLEFYGIKNTGVSDAQLYDPVSSQPHQYHNIYNDTTHYFLTVNTLAELGKRMETFAEVNVGGLPAETHHANERLLVLASQYNTGIKYITYIQNTFFETGEGWTGNQLSQNQFVEYSIDNITNSVQSAGNPQLEVQVVGRAEVSHRVEISVGPAAGTRVVATADFFHYNTHTITAALNWSDVGADGRIVVRVRALGVNGAADRLSASYIKITFPQNFNLAGSPEKFYYLNENAGNKSFIQFQNEPAFARVFDVTDPNEVGIIENPSGTMDVIVPNTATSRKLLVTSNFTIPAIRKVSFRNIDPPAHDYIIISHAALMKPSGAYANPVKAYAEYRASAPGGSYDTLVVDIHQLYNQFNYGEISPLAISRFMAFMVNGGSPRYLFIIGKGLDVSWGYHRNPAGFSFHDYVPSAGMPASDVFFTAGLDGTTFEPAVPTGRITSNNPNDVAAYLNKVKEMEAVPFNELWRKELLHLSGGINPGEPEAFKYYMEEFGAIAENFYLGGKVSAIAKNNTDIEFINISDKVNSGLNLVTLFGHSSPSQNDFNIGFVSAPELGYNNTGKYPMFLINGCNAGDFFFPGIRYGEDWINTPAKGALGFMANTSFGYSSILRAYANVFYGIAYGDSVFIHKGIGDIQKEAIKQVTDLSSTVGFVTQGQQMFLLGDPAVKLFGASKPDYETSDNYVYAESYNADPITALSDSFAINIIVRNFGRAREDSIAVRVLRTFSDNTTATYDSLYYPVLYRDTLTFTIYKDENGFGNNIFEITLDPLNEINEIDKSNNTAQLDLFIPLNSARNLYPQGFSIINSPTTNLLVQSTDVLGAPRDFIIQVDTVDTFNSPYVREFTVNGKIATQEIDLITTLDTLAFYWRTRLAEPEPNESADWTTSSFSYIKDGPEGWAQVHFPQYLANEPAGLVLDAQARVIRLKETITDVAIHTFGSAHPSSHTALSVQLNNTEYNPISFPELQCRDNTINLIAFDKTTTVPYVAIPVQYPDKKACGRRPEVIVSLRSTEIETGNGKDLIQYVDNVPEGDSVVLFSIGDPGYSTWSVNVQNKLAELGISSAQISSLQAGEPVIIFARKGAPSGSATINKTSLSPANAQALQSEGTITGRFLSGTMTSPTIGPAVQWGSLNTTVTISELPDAFSVDVIGINLTGERTLLKTGVVNVIENLSDINAAEFPYLELVFHATDEINLTAPQLNKWLVEYTPAPEGVLNFHSALETQQLKEGETWTGAYGFYNISQKEFSDSLTVEYTALNTTARVSRISNKKIKAPLPGQETLFDVDVYTKGLGGLNDVKVYVNPRVLPELYYDNNVLTLQDHIGVAPDIFNPVLDVTIDGRYVFDGDFVSPKPSIVIKLWDENSLIQKTDTLGITVFLKYPCDTEDCPFTPIYFTRNDVAWQPANATTDFTMTFTPPNLPEGNYTLRVDVSSVQNSVSADEPYEITFEVVSDQSVSVQPPYPNPSTSVFFFNVVITGDVQPDQLTLEIINPNGQTVQTATHHEFFTGTNVVAWDASPLVSGLYFYKLFISREGKEITGSSGKIMLVR